MRYLYLLITLVFISCGSDKKDEKSSENVTKTTYYLIRHAEKDRSTTDDPGLITIGKERAIKWAEYFENIPLDAVYSTDYNRTKETAAPTAKSQSLTVQVYNEDNLYDAQFQEATKGKTVLVVGHSNTTPAFANTIVGENRFPQISDTENGMLYKVIISDNGITTVTTDKIEL